MVVRRELVVMRIVGVHQVSRMRKVMMVAVEVVVLEATEVEVMLLRRLLLLLLLM